MSSLRERLNRMKGTGGSGSGTADLREPEGGAIAGEEARSVADEEGAIAGEEALTVAGAAADEEGALGHAAASSSAPSLSDFPSANEWEALTADWVETEWGPFIRRRTAYSLRHRHGKYRLGELNGALSGLDAFGEPVAAGPESLLFFDTETTGLGQGAGNVPFMIGLGFYRGEEFLIEQLFIRNPAEELAMLAYLNDKLMQHSHLVSYNGKSFDWPLVLNRYVMNRMKPGRTPAVHLDFLHPSRSLWKHTLPSCRLGKVEEERLGFRRVEDVPGSLAPTLYFRYLAEKDPEIMRGVFVHNEWDLLSLAGLSIHFGTILQGGLPLAETEAEEDYRLGLWLAKMGKAELAETAFHHLDARPPEESGDYWHPLGLYYKKQGQPDTAAELWRRAVRERGGRAWAPVEPYVELSMYHEHTLKDYAQALAYAEDALSAMHRRCSLARASDKQRAELTALEKRLERLRRKASAAKAPPAAQRKPRPQPEPELERRPKPKLEPEPERRPERQAHPVRQKKSAPPPAFYAGSLFD